jgi:3',5'-cyclic AMP phosphodiesterase CpdA
MLIAQITDCHVRREGKLLYGALDTAAMLEAAVAKLAALDPRPDVVLATGDLVDAGDAAEYARLRRLLGGIGARLLLLPGNHDRRGPLRAAFPELGYLAGPDGFCCYADESGPVRLVALDSTEEGRIGGVFDAARLAWLDRTLAARPDAPTLVFTHHPPFTTAIAHMDEYGTVDADEFAAVVARHRQVVRVVAGHVHRAMTVAWAGTICTTCPSTAHQFALDLGAGVPAHWTDEPPGFQLHHWLAGRGLVTHTATTRPHGRTQLGH